MKSTLTEEEIKVIIVTIVTPENMQMGHTWFKKLQEAVMEALNKQ